MARRREAWDHTSILWALIANAHRDEKHKRDPYRPADIHPFLSEQKKSKVMTIGEAAKLAQAQEQRFGKRD